MRDLLQRPDLFSINTATLGYKTPLPAIIDACAARGIGAIAPWRRELQGEDLQQIAHQLAASNMSVSGLCRSTYYTAPTLAERKLAIDDNRRALDDAAVLNAACYMQVVGGLPTGTKDLYEAREQVKQGIRQLLPHSKDVGVPIALEPLQPIALACARYARRWTGVMNSIPMVSLASAWRWMFITSGGIRISPVRSCVPENASSRFMFPTG